MVDGHGDPLVERGPLGGWVQMARGPGGVRARLGRHLRGDGRPRWHVDFLRAHAAPLAWAWTTALPDEVPWECLWSQALADLPSISVPVPGFGASDCRRGCLAHLLFCPWEAWLAVWATRRTSVPGLT